MTSGKKVLWARRRWAKKNIGEDARLARAVRHATNGITVVEAADDGGFHTVYVNPAFEGMTGYGLDEIVSHGYEILHGPDTDPDAAEKVAAAFRNGKSAVVEVLNYRKDGTLFWKELNVTPVPGSGGTLDFYLCVHRDVTERVRVRLTLEERTAMLNEAERIARFGHWSWELETGRVWWSPQVYRIGGLDPAHYQPTLDRTMEVYHPDDRETVLRVYREAAEQRSSFSIETRIMRPGGELRFVRVEGRYLTRPRSTFDYLFGTVQDITERRQAEGALKRREEQYRRLMETVPLGIKETDPEGRILYANPAHHLHLGYSDHELLGTSMFDLVPEGGARLQAIREFETVLDGRPAHFISTYRNANGDTVDVDVRAVATRNDHGKIDSVITVSTDITDQLNDQERLRQLAYFDDLTGLGNRSLFREFLESALADGRRRNSLAVVFVNVDGFQVINEAFGRTTGDFVVKTLADRLQHWVGDKEHVARLGGDELGVLLAGNRDRPALLRRLRDLKTTLEASLEWEGQRVDISLSVGVAVYPRDAGDADQLLQGADTALRDAKQQEPGGIRFYSAAMKTAAEEFMILRRRLREAREQQEFFLEYQPQVDLRTDRIVGFEALARWRASDGSIIPPTRFIPVAEQTGDIVAIGRWMLKSVCAQIKAWAEAGVEIVPVAVNLSARQLLQDDIARVVADILHETRVDSRFVQLELTETALMVDSRGALRRMQELNDLGIALALDDFGTGYSSLSHLSQFPIQSLKIDQSFISEMTRSTKQASLVSGVIAMGNRLGLEVLAEGVEDQRQLRFLKSHQCDLAQGFYYSRPVSAEAAGELLKEGLTLPAVPEIV